VRALVGLESAAMAHFELAPGEVSIAVHHRTIDELWYFVSGQGEMWRAVGDDERVIDVHEGVAVTIPCGTLFQFRSTGTEPLAAVAVNIPPWPGEGEAVRATHQKWHPTVHPGPGLGVTWFRRS
jgi:mannose-6-phosphate isomerase-like protein (cupin superfamily)